jgi:hypothetical protein
VKWIECRASLRDSSGMLRDQVSGRIDGLSCPTRSTCRPYRRTRETKPDGAVAAAVTTAVRGLGCSPAELSESHWLLCGGIGAWQGPERSERDSRRCRTKDHAAHTPSGSGIAVLATILSIDANGRPRFGYLSGDRSTQKGGAGPGADSAWRSPRRCDGSQGYPLSRDVGSKLPSMNGSDTRRTAVSLLRTSAGRRRKWDACPSSWRVTVAIPRPRNGDARRSLAVATPIE